MRWMIVFGLIAGAAICADAGDWPVWRGPAFSGVSDEQLPADLPNEAPILWRTKVGTGFGTVSVARGRLFTMGNENDRDTVWCLNARTGELIWKHSYDCPLDPLYYEGGPSATPTIEDDAVYTFSKKGQVFRFDFGTGEIRWGRDIRTELDLELPEWSFASSPYIHGNLVILNAGDSGTALDKDSGEIAWKSGARTAGYATPVPVKKSGGEVELLLFGGREFMGLNPKTGAVRWRVPWETGREVNAADPIVSGDQALVTSAIGAAVFEISEESEPREIWRQKSALRCYFNAPVLVGGHLYAIHGTTHRPTELVCLDWATGETRWAEPGFGSGALMAAGNRGILFDKGQLTIFELNPEEYRPAFQQQILSGKCWTVPVLANGVVYCRNAEGDLAAVQFGK